MSGEAGATNSTTTEGGKPPPQSALTTGEDTSKAAPPAGAAPGDAKKAEGTEGAKADQTTPAAFDFSKWEPKAVEGLTRDAKTLGEVRKVFGDLKLNGEQAQKLLDFSDAQLKASAQSWEQAQLKSVEENRSKSFEALKTHKTLGGQNFDASIKAAQRAVRDLGGQPLADRLFALGLDNDPVLVEAFVNAGKRMGEDTVDGTAGKPGADKSDSFEARIARTYSKSKES